MRNPVQWLAGVPLLAFLAGGNVFLALWDLIGASNAFSAGVAVFISLLAIDMALDSPTVVIRR